jgi:uroporphyrinogen decarboxylase
VHTRWTIEHLLKDIEDIDKYLSIPWQPSEVDMADFYHRQTELGAHGVMMLSVSDPICLVAGLFEMGTFLVHALTEPERISYMLDVVHERQMAELNQILAHDVRGVMFRIVGPEYATPPYLGPDHFRQYVTRYLAPICEAITRAGGFARVHCHGKIGQVLDQIVAAGAQGIDPVEPPPDSDMELGAIKKRYGKRLCLFCNIELKELEIATPERIDQLVRLAMEQAKEGGGFVLMPTAAPINVPLSSKTESNYYRYIEAGLKYGLY